MKIGGKYVTEQKDDRLPKIAQQEYEDDSEPYQKAICRMNKFEIGDNPNVIRPGIRLWIPPFAELPQENSYYIVKADDTLSSIALQAYKKDTQPYRKAIYWLNQFEIGDDPKVIHANQPLWIPPIEPESTFETFYIVKAGDTLSSIAKQAYPAYEENQWWKVIYGANKKVKMIRDDQNRIILRGKILFIPRGPIEPGGGNILIPVNPTWL